VLSSRLSAAADLSRYVASARVREVKVIGEGALVSVGVDGRSVEKFAQHNKSLHPIVC